MLLQGCHAAFLANLSAFVNLSFLLVNYGYKYAISEPGRLLQVFGVLESEDSEMITQ